MVLGASTLYRTTTRPVVRTYRKNSQNPRKQKPPATCFLPCSVGQDPESKISCVARKFGTTYKYYNRTHSVLFCPGTTVSLEKFFESFSRSVVHQAVPYKFWLTNSFLQSIQSLFSGCFLSGIMKLPHSITIGSWLMIFSVGVRSFAPTRPFIGAHPTSRRYVAADIPPPPSESSNAPIIRANPYGQPSDIRYSDFLKLVNSDRIEKVTFSPDGSQLLGVDVDGIRVKIESLPNDPDLLTQLTTHKVRIVDWN